MVVIAGDSAAERGLKVRLCSLGIGAEVGDIAHKQHAEFVSPVIEPRFIDFDMETQEIEPEFLRACDIGANCLIGEEGVDSLWVKGLIQCAEQIDGAVVEVDILVVASGCFLNGDFAHAEVGRDSVDNGVVGYQFQRYVVKIRCVDIPELQIFWWNMDGELRHRFSRFLSCRNAFGEVGLSAESLCVTRNRRCRLLIFWGVMA